MFDPGAYGTLLVWLDADDQDARRRPRRRHPVAARRRPSSIRTALASGLRRAASALDRPGVGAIGEVTNG